MKVGVNRWTLPGDLSLPECFRLANQSGFQSIEVNIAEEGELTPETSESDVRGLARAAREVGIELSSLSTGLGWKYPLTSSDAAVRDRAIDILKRSLQVAQWLGVDTILCVPGTVTAEVSYDEAYRRAQEGLKGLADIAKACGVTIGVENVWNKFLLSPLEMVRFIDEIGSTYVGSYFDAGNVLVFGFPQHWIRILGARIKKVHVKDFKIGIGNISGFCNPLQGDVPWSAVRDALLEVGYNQYITAEVDGYRVHPEIGLKHVAESLKTVFG